MSKTKLEFNDENECIICFSKLDIKKEILQCGHCFHKKCINNWFKKQRTCPICRKYYHKKTFFGILDMCCTSNTRFYYY